MLTRLIVVIVLRYIQIQNRYVVHLKLICSMSIISRFYFIYLFIFKFFLKIYLFIYYLFLAVLGLCFCARAFSSCGEWGPLFIVVRGPLTVAASLVAEHRLQTRRLSSCGSRAQSLRGMRDLPRPRLEPVSPALQADSQPLHHQGSPYI